MKNFELGITDNNQFIISLKPIYCFIKIIPVWLLSITFATAAIYYIHLIILGILFLLLSLYKYFYIRSIKYIFQQETLSIRTGVINLTLNTFRTIQSKRHHS